MGEICRDLGRDVVVAMPHTAATPQIVDLRSGVHALGLAVDKVQQSESHSSLQFDLFVVCVEPLVFLDGSGL
jgi:hypothetical protein